MIKTTTLFTTLFSAVSMYAQTPMTHFNNGGFEAGTHAYIELDTEHNWKGRILANANATIGTFATEAGVGYLNSNGFHLNIADQGSSQKGSIRMDMAPNNATITPAPTTVTTEGIITFTVNLKIKISADILKQFQIQSRIRDAQGSDIIPTSIEALVDGPGGITHVTIPAGTGKADIDATGITLNTWHDVQVDYQYPDVTVLTEHQDFILSMGKIPEGVDFYVDDISVTMKAGASTLSTVYHSIEDAKVIFPNPVLDVLNYKTKDVLSASVYNLLGQKIKEQRATGSIQIANLKKGIYILNLKTKDGSVYSEKFVKK